MRFWAALAVLCSAATSAAATGLQPLIGNESVLYVSPTGVSGGSCTIDAPCSLTYASGGAGRIIGPGATIYLRDGIYHSVDGYVISTVGSSNRPIVWAAYPDEHPLIDGAFPEFETPGNSAWEPYDITAHHHIYRSTATYAFSKAGEESGSIEINGVWFALVTHPRGTDYITSDDQLWTGSSPRYLGPGFAWNPSSLGGDDKIYIRLDAADATAMQNTFPAVPVARTVAAPTDTDPRRLALYLSPMNKTGVSIRGEYNQFGAGISIKNYDLGIGIAAAHITIKDVTLAGNYEGIRPTMRGEVDVTVDGATIDGYLPTDKTVPSYWLSWCDVKCGNIPAHHTRKEGLEFKQTDHWMITHTTFRHLFDGILGDVNSHDIELSYSTFDGIWDDGWQMYCSLYHVNVHHNFFYGAGPSHDATGCPSPGEPNVDPGTVYIHHNVIDTTFDPIFFGRNGRTRRPVGVEEAIPHSTHGLPKGYNWPWKYYYNTVVQMATPTVQPSTFDKPGAVNPDAFLILSEFGRKAPNSNGATEEYNNILISVYAIGQDFDCSTGRFIEDGNVFSGKLPASNRVGRWRTLHTSTGIVDSSTTPLLTTGQLRATQCFKESQAYYPPGWEASGLDVDPGLNANYQPTNPVVKTGAVDITSKGWPGAGVYEPWRGAIAP